MYFDPNIVTLTIPLVLLAAFAAAAFYQLVLTLAVHARLAAHKSEPPSREPLPVSLVIAARNEKANLERLLPALMEQTHPRFEIILVDDRSDDETYDYLLSLRDYSPKLRILFNKDVPDHIHPKKFALTLGIKAAQYQQVVFTDADCLPASPDWLLEIQACYTPGTRIVLGYCPYEKQPGFLNLLIRYETYYTALQYLSWALAGRPYMGIGRNLSYERSLFFENKGFYKHQHVTGGDDDLFINRVGTSANTRVVVHPASQTISKPKESWGAWFRQKKRHLSVGKYYKWSDKILLTMGSLSQLGFWLLALPAVAFGGYPEWAGGLFGLRVVAQLTVNYFVVRRMQDSVPFYLTPLLDFLHAIYHIFVGIVALTSRHIRWS